MVQSFKRAKTLIWRRQQSLMDEKSPPLSEAMFTCIGDWTLSCATQTQPTNYIGLIFLFEPFQYFPPICLMLQFISSHQVF